MSVVRAAAGRLALVALILGAGSGPARADDHVDLVTTVVTENRAGNAGNLTVISPDVDAGFDLGDHVTLDLGYTVDVVSGATAAVYAIDAVSSATRFEDTRHGGRLALGFRGRRSALRFSAGAASERDQTSMSLTTTGRITLPGRNTDLALAYRHGLDQICDRDNGTVTALERLPLSGLDPCEKTGLFGNDLPGVTVWHDLRVDSTTATLIQNLAPSVNLELVLYGEILRGFQSNPYRRVRVRNLLAQENLPDLRSRIALTVRVNKHLRVVRGAVHVAGRGYGDSWGVSSGMGELGYSQYLGPRLLLRFHTRYYQQSAAAFFRDAYYYETQGQSADFFTGAQELGRLRTITLGGKLSLLELRRARPVWGAFDEVRLNLGGDLLFLQQLANPDDGPNPAGIGHQFLSAGEIFRGFVLQVGLQLAY